MNALSPITSPPVDGCWLGSTPTQPRAWGYAESARHYHPQAQRMHAEAVASLELAQSVRDPFVRVDAVRRATRELKQCAGVLESARRYLARVECEGTDR